MKAIIIVVGLASMATCHASDRALSPREQKECRALTRTEEIEESNLLNMDWRPGTPKSRALVKACAIIVEGDTSKRWKTAAPQAAPSPTVTPRTPKATQDITCTLTHAIQHNKLDMLATIIDQQPDALFELTNEGSFCVIQSLGCLDTKQEIALIRVICSTLMTAYEINDPMLQTHSNHAPEEYYNDQHTLDTLRLKLVITLLHLQQKRSTQDLQYCVSSLKSTQQRAHNLVDMLKNPDAPFSTTDLMNQ